MKMISIIFKKVISIVETFEFNFEIKLWGDPNASLQFFSIFSCFLLLFIKLGFSP
jgi:hypothetical protein